MRTRFLMLLIACGPGAPLPAVAPAPVTPGADRTAEPSGEGAIDDGRRPAGDLGVKIHGVGCTTCGGPAEEVRVQFGDPHGDFRGLAGVEIERAVKARAGIWRACYRKELRHTPDLAGDLELRFELALDGAVRSASIGARSTLHDTGLESCVMTNFMRLTFPADHDGASIEYLLGFSHGP